ncbi:hypothetical protein [Nocardia sp. NPDC058633]|uniref:hypothetical protein n=1 Tax=Nocardia sp. NPDC058633 TaxID=3346568 RepID=UPI00364B2BDD
MNKLAASTALGIFLLASALGTGTAHAQQPVADSGSSSLDVLCSPVGGLLVAVGSAENRFGPFLSVVCLNR